MKECPKCGLTNPDSAPGGRCGYKFQDFPDFKRRLEEKLESLVQRHEQFQQEIDKLRDEMDGLELHDTVPVAEDAAGVRDEIETAAESQKAADDSKQSLDSKEGSSVQPALISS